MHLLNGVTGKLRNPGPGISNFYSKKWPLPEDCSWDWGGAFFKLWKEVQMLGGQKE